MSAGMAALLALACAMPPAYFCKWLPTALPFHMQQSMLHARVLAQQQGRVPTGAPCMQQLSATAGKNGKDLAGQHRPSVC